METITLGKISIKYPKSYERFIGLIADELTGKTERRNERLVRELEEQALRQVVPKRIKRDFRTEQLIRDLENEIIDTVKVPDYIISMDKTYRVLKLCLHRVRATKNRRGWDFKGAGKISKVVGLPFYICVRALLEVSGYKRRGEYAEAHRLHRTLETLAEARL